MKDRDIISLVKKSALTSELEFETALSADRILRRLAKSDPSMKEIRQQLRGLMAEYEKKHWSDVNKITDEQVDKSDAVEKFAEIERKFIDNRKKLILSRLRKLKLNQNDFGALLGHNKSYASELLNGIRPFSQKDLILIHGLLKIGLDDLIFVKVPIETRRRIEICVSNLERVKLKKSSLELVAA